MKKRITILMAIVFAVTSLGAISACQTKHEHQFTYYVSKAPTCTEGGVLEGICECGKKDFQEIKAGHVRDESGVCSECGDGGQEHSHEWAWTTIVEPTCVKTGFALGACACGATNQKALPASEHVRDESGVCSVCGDGETKIEEGQVLGITIEKAYQTLKSYGYEETIEEFKSLIGNYDATNIKVDALGNVQLILEAYGQEMPIVLFDQRIEFKISIPAELDYVHSLKIKEGKLACTLSDGTEIDLGLIDGFSGEGNKKLKSIFINKNNLFFAAYSDDTAQIVGKIATTTNKIDGGELRYIKINDNEYAVAGVLNKNLTEIEIPATHRGVPITKIASNAFRTNDKLTKVTLGENIKNIESFAFYECKNLQTVVLNEQLTKIDNYCFSHSENLARVVIPSKVSIISRNAFYGTTCSIFAEIDQKPLGWDSNAFTANNRIYWNGEWEYINGIPAPLK